MAFIEFVTLHSNCYCVGMVFVTSTSPLTSRYTGGGSHVSVVVLSTLRIIIQLMIGRPIPAHLILYMTSC